MTIREFQDSLEYLFKAQLTGFVWGHAGIGKTTAIKQYAMKKGYHFFPLYLGTQSDLGDVLGLQDFVRDEKGTAVATTFAPPTWLKDTLDYCEKNPDSGAIIFLDEFNRARRDIISGMFSLALDKKFHTVQLPPNCYVIAAGNPPTEEYNTTDVDETALMARFVHIKLEPTFDEWVQFAKATEIEPSLIDFLQQQPNLLEDHKSDFQLPVKVDRRSISRLDALFKVNTPPYLLTKLMQGIIGAERTVAYESYLKSSDRPLAGLDILNAAKGSQDTIKKWLGDLKDIKSSLISATCKNVLTELKTMHKEGTTLTPEQDKNLFDFISSLPAESLFIFLRDVAMLQLKSTIAFCNNKLYAAKLVELMREAKGLVSKETLQSAYTEPKE